MTVLEEYVSIEAGLQLLLVANFPELDGGEDGPFHTGTVYPADLKDRLPFAAVARIGGPQSALESNPLVDIDIFADTRPAAYSLSARVSAFLLGYPRSVKVGTRLLVLDSVFETSGQVELPWEDADVRRFKSTYQISARR